MDFYKLYAFAYIRQAVRGHQRPLMSKERPVYSLSMSSILDAYAEEFRALEGNLEKELGELKMCSADEEGSPHTTHMKQMTALLSQGMDLVKQMEIEVRSSQGGGTMKEKVGEYKRALKRFQGDFATQKNRLNRSTLMSGADGPALGKSAEQRQRLLDTNDKLERQNEAILNAQRTVAETEEVGIEITEQLARNREQIQSSRDRLGEFTGITDSARRMISSMQRRSMQSKFFIAFVMVVVLVVIIVAIWYGVNHRKKSEK